METDWRSIYILTIVMFLGSFKMAATSSGLWAYMKLMDPDVTESFFGVINSVANFTNLMMSFVAGVICDRLGDTKICIVIGKSLWIFAIIAYLAVEIMPGHARFWFLIMEVCFGFSMGLMSVSRTTVSMNSTEEDRPRAFSVMTLAMSIGLAVGPAIVVPMTMLSYPGFEMPFGVHLNLYTAPMYFVLLTTIISIILLIIWFDGKMRVVEKKDKTLVPKIESKSRFNLNFETSYDKFAVFICCLTRIIQTTSMLFLMNVGGPYLMTIYGWTSKDLLQYNSILHTAIGVIAAGICALYIFKIAQKYLSDRRAIVISIALKLAYFILTYPYPFLTSKIPMELKDANGTIVQNGCSSRFDWCETTPQIHLWIFTVSSVLCFGAGIPLIMLNLDVLYSKVLGDIKQGKMQGMFLVSGEVLTIVGPVIFTSVYEATGPVYIWQFNIVTIAGILILWMVYYERMISASRREAESESDMCRGITTIMINEKL